MVELFKHQMTHLTIIIPVLNEGLLIDELIRRVKLNVGTLTQDYEILFIDDGSSDDTWSKINLHSLDDKRVKGIKFSRNFGHHFAITAGLNNSSGDWVIVMDGDLQDRPEVVPELYHKALEGFDVVFVSRVNRPEKAYYRLLQKLFYFLLNIFSGLDFNSKQANFSIIKRKVVNAFNLFPEASRFYVSTIKWLGFKTSSITANHGERFLGKPSYTVRKRFKLAIDIILAFSNKPLRFIVYLGIILSAFSILLVLLILTVDNLALKQLNSELTLTLVLLLLGGVTLLALGIIGIYVGNIYTQVKQRPLYIISEKINF
jgi:glycosyltransferase involved in cell wall biosynthesis